jgi:hypothetical protein
LGVPCGTKMLVVENEDGFSGVIVWGGLFHVEQEVLVVENKSNFLGVVGRGFCFTWNKRCWLSEMREVFLVLVWGVCSTWNKRCWLSKAWMRLRRAIVWDFVFHVEQKVLVVESANEVEEGDCLRFCVPRETRNREPCIL